MGRRKNYNNEQTLKKWIAEQQKTRPGHKFLSREINFGLGLTVNYVGNTLRWIPGVRNSGKFQPGQRVIWEILPVGVDRND